MDPLVRLMDAPRARSAFTLHLVMSPPWSIDIREGAALDLIVITSGTLFLDTGTERVEAGPGDVLLVRGPEPYVVSDHPGRIPTITIEPGQRCVSEDGEELHQSMCHGVGTWGNDPEGTHTAIIGSYEDTGEVGHLGPVRWTTGGHRSGAVRVLEVPEVGLRGTSHHTVGAEGS